VRLPSFLFFFFFRSRPVNNQEKRHRARTLPAPAVTLQTVERQCCPSFPLSPLPLKALMTRHPAADSYSTSPDIQHAQLRVVYFFFPSFLWFLPKHDSNMSKLTLFWLRKAETSIPAICPPPPPPPSPLPSSTSGQTPL